MATQSPSRYSSRRKRPSISGWSFQKDAIAKAYRYIKKYQSKTTSTTIKTRHLARLASGHLEKTHILTKWWYQKPLLQNECSTSILQLELLTQTTPDISGLARITSLDPEGFGDLLERN